MKQTALLIIAVLFTAAAAPASVQAHQNDLGEIVVSHAYAEPATKGGTSRVRFEIENTSGQTVQLLGMEIEAAEWSEIRVDIGDGQSAPLNSLGIRPGEFVEFERTAWIQLYGLKRPLLAGSIVEGHLMIAGRPCTPIQVSIGSFAID